jgi:mannose-6-phosphate isomerase-like protein (cupin superfamily)
MSNTGARSRADGADQPADSCGGADHDRATNRRVAACRTALAPAGSRLVLAEWSAKGCTGDKSVYQTPLHAHPEDEAWYLLQGTLAVRAGELFHRSLPEAR